MYSFWGCVSMFLISGQKFLVHFFFWLIQALTFRVDMVCPFSLHTPKLWTLRARAHWPLCLATCGRVFVAGIFIPVGNHYFQALASTLQFVSQVCDRLWLVPATDRAFAYITYMSLPHVALVCSGPPQKRGHMWLNKVASVLGP